MCSRLFIHSNLLPEFATVKQGAPGKETLPSSIRRSWALFYGVPARSQHTKCYHIHTVYKPSYCSISNQNNKHLIATGCFRSIFSPVDWPVVDATRSQSRTQKPSNEDRRRPWTAWHLPNVRVRKSASGPLKTNKPYNTSMEVKKLNKNLRNFDGFYRKQFQMHRFRHLGSPALD